MGRQAHFFAEEEVMAGFWGGRGRRTACGQTPLRAKISGFRFTAPKSKNAGEQNFAPLLIYKALRPSATMPINFIPTLALKVSVKPRYCKQFSYESRRFYNHSQCR